MPPVTSKFNVPVLTNKIKVGLEKKMRQRLGIQDNQPLPQDVVSFIDKTSQSVASNAVELGVTRDSEVLAREASRTAIFEGFKEKVGTALEGMDIIALSPEVKQILNRRAELLWAKRKALEGAGFSIEEAMKILLADIKCSNQ